MRGHVRRRGNGPRPWCAVYDEPGGEDGKRQQRWRSGYRTKTEAQEALSSILSSIAEKTYVAPERITFRELAEPTVRHRLGPSTQETYNRVLRLHVFPAIGGIPLQKLDPTHLDRMYRQLVEGKLGEKKPLAPSTVRIVAAVVSSALRWAHKKRLVSVNVAALADVPSSPRKRRGTWSPEQVRQFLNHTSSERLAALWRFLALTGARRGEALALTRWALDLDAGTARIERQLVPLKTGLAFLPTKTGAGERTVHLDPGTLEALRRHVEAQDGEREAWGDAYQDTGLVFCREDGSPLDPRGISQAFQVRRKGAKLPPLPLHGLRHSAATNLAMTVKAHPETVRAQLGHSSTATTLGYYTHAVEDVSRKAADALGSAVDGDAVCNPLAGETAQDTASA